MPIVNLETYISICRIPPEIDIGYILHSKNSLSFLRNDVVSIQNAKHRNVCNNVICSTHTHESAEEQDCTMSLTQRFF